MAKQTNRTELINQMASLYLSRAYSDQELGKTLNTSRSNIFKIRTKMQNELGYAIEEDQTHRGKYKIFSKDQITKIPLTPYESLALYLGGRHLQQQTRTYQLAVTTALSKLSKALRQPMAEELVRAVQAVMNQEQDEHQTKVLQEIVNGWLVGRRVRIRHRKLYGQLRVYSVAPYLLEPSVWSDAIYLIGHSDYHDNIASFKVGRIESAMQTTEGYEMPALFNIHDLLKHSWGIWHADEQPITIRLHFNRQITPRVIESIWHPSQEINLQPDGSCFWTAQIAEWQEMEPWIRGWGGDVEVLEPLELRETMMGQAKRLAEKYGWFVSSQASPNPNSTLADFFAD